MKGFESLERYVVKNPVIFDDQTVFDHFGRIEPLKVCGQSTITGYIGKR